MPEERRQPRYEDEDPRATVPIVAGSNFARSAIGRDTGASDRIAIPILAPRRPRRRIWLVLLIIVGVLLVASGAAVCSYLLLR
jgi:hypothetical protein